LLLGRAVPKFSRGNAKRKTDIFQILKTRQTQKPKIGQKWTPNAMTLSPGVRWNIPLLAFLSDMRGLNP